MNNILNFIMTSGNSSLVIKDHDENGFDYHFCEIIDLKQLQKDWIALHSFTNASFFQSWPWIETWISSVTTNYHMPIYQLSIYDDNELVSLSLYCINTIKRCSFIPQRAILMHECGEKLDKITIEYNQDLIQSAYSQNTLELCSWFLIKHFIKKHTICLPGLIKKISPTNDTLYISSKPRTHHWIDLNELRKKNIDFLTSLNKNTRYKLRRSYKKLSQIGPISIEHAKTRSDAIEFFEQMTQIHSEYWNSKKIKSDFIRQEVNDFHRNLIKNHFHQEKILLYKLTVDSKTLGIFYLFNHKGHVTYYQSGINKLPDNKVLTGLTSHQLLIEKFIKDPSIHSYDFMCGDYQYKKSLSNKKNQQYWTYMTKNTLFKKLLLGIKCNFSTS